MKNKSILKNPGMILAIYWIVLVIWQIISGTEVKSTPDLIIKIGLIIYLIISYFVINKSIKIKRLLICSIFACSLFPAFINEKFELSIFIFYMFIVLLVMLHYCIGEHFCICEKQYLIILRIIIFVCLISSFYAIIFCTQQFIDAFKIDNAYGNQLSSFFDSSHTYGMYLSAGIISCLFCLKNNISIGRKCYYIICLFLFLPNLILTFSRTSIFSVVIFLFFFILFGKNKKIKFILFISVIVVTVSVLSIPTLSNFMNNIIFKKGNVAGRDILLERSFELFNSLSFKEKIFGVGKNYLKEYFETKKSQQQ